MVAMRRGGSRESLAPARPVTQKCGDKTALCRLCRHGGTCRAAAHRGAFARFNVVASSCCSFAGALFYFYILWLSCRRILHGCRRYFSSCGAIYSPDRYIEAVDPLSCMQTCVRWAMLENSNDDMSGNDLRTGNALWAAFRLHVSRKL